MERTLTHVSRNYVLGSPWQGVAGIFCHTSTMRLVFKDWAIDKNMACEIKITMNCVKGFDRQRNTQIKDLWLGFLSYIHYLIFLRRTTKQTNNKTKSCLRSSFQRCMHIFQRGMCTINRIVSYYRFCASRCL